jgi:hypothetical protein
MKKRMLTLLLLFLQMAPFLNGQNKGAEETKTPIQATILPNKMAPPEYEIGNVIVTYSDGTTDSWTVKGNCAAPKVSLKGAVGWEVYKLNPDGKTLARYDGLRINDHLTVCDHGRVVANLAAAKGFIEDWDFTKDGEHLVIKSRGTHGPATIELFSLRNGPAAKSVQAYQKNLPDWAAPFADAS